MNCLNVPSFLNFIFSYNAIARSLKSNTVNLDFHGTEFCYNLNR